MKKRCFKLLMFLLVASLLAAAVSAAEFEVTISPDYKNIKLGETAEYILTVKNNMAETEKFEIYSPDVMWDLTTYPVSDRLMSVDPGVTKSTSIRLTPLYVHPGRYGVNINVRVSGKNMLTRTFAMVGVNDPNPPPGEYLPAIRSSVEMVDVVDPRENITIKIKLENQNRRELEDMDIRIRSNAINTDYRTNLGALEKKELTITTRVDPLTEPQDDLLKVLIFMTAGPKTYQYETTPFEFQIIHYGGLVESVDEVGKLFKTTRTITLTNEGNGDVIDVYKMEKGFFGKIFFSSEPEFKNYKEDGVKYVGWPVNLAPYEKTTITVVESYRVPFGILAAIIIIIILYFLIRSPILVHKSAVVLATKEGGISELKILIVVKNRTGKELKNVSIIDKVPHIADVLREFEMGTLHPVNILKHEKKGTLIKWELKDLDTFEERVLAYKIKSRLSVLGEFKLPVVVVKFETKSGQKRSTHSNMVSIVGA